MLTNTTDIPDQLIFAAIKHGLPPDTDLPAHFIIKNKKGGKVGGHWGWYYNQERRVVLIVPRVLKRPVTFPLKYSKRPIEIRSRGEFLVAVMAHELRHHYQFTHWNGWRLQFDSLGKLAREVDAELYELRKLEEWRLIFSQ